MGEYISNQILVLHKAMWLFMGKLNGAYEWNYSANNTNTQINVQAIQVQYIQTTSKSCASLYSEDFTATVKAKPTGYEYMFVPINSYRSVTRMTGLSGTTASFQVSNISSSTRDVNAVGWLIYFPNILYIWIYKEHIQRIITTAHKSL